MTTSLTTQKPGAEPNEQRRVTKKDQLIKLLSGKAGADIKALPFRQGSTAAHGWCANGTGAAIMSMFSKAVSGWMAASGHRSQLLPSISQARPGRGRASSV